MNKIYSLIAFAAMLFLFSCKKDPTDPAPVKKISSFTIDNTSTVGSTYDIEFKSGTTTYTYDISERVTSVSKSAADGFQGARNYTFQYNTNSELPVSGTFKAAAPGTLADEMHYYFYNSDRQLVRDSSVALNLLPTITTVRLLTYSPGRITGYSTSTRMQANGSVGQSFVFDTVRLDVSGNISQFVSKYRLGSTDELSVFDYTYDTNLSPFGRLNIFRAGVYFQPAGLENPSLHNVISLSQVRSYPTIPVNVNRDFTGGYTYKDNLFPSALSKNNVGNNGENIKINFLYNN